MIFLSPITDIERRFVVTSMSNAKMNLPDSADAINRYRDDLAKNRATTEKKKSTVDKSKEDVPAAPEHTYTSFPKQSLTWKRQRNDSTVDHGKKVESSSKTKSADVFEPDSSMILLPFGILSFNEPSGFLEKLNEFLLFTNEEFLKKKKMEDVFNISILSAFEFKKANDTLKADKAKVNSALKELKQKCIALEKDLKDKEEERDRYREESTKAKAVVVEQERLVADLKEQPASIAAAAMCKARAEVFKEYLSSEHVNWSREEMQEVVDTYEKMLRLEELSPGEVAGEEEAIESDVDKSLDERLHDITSPNDNVADPPVN
ncbi:hypothetical protein LWI29_022335 [Acer saccharum]|uniref:Uncharacterized protein n=1 Tax=Acer saccharum TaxID=4024 RepID=A0AA39S4M9_ACESA|nr:hypothetical protein LWI29_022335 [Acer saccharum]